MEAWSAVSYRWGLVIIGTGCLLYLIWQVYDRMIYEYEVHETDIQAKRGRFLSFLWLLISVLCIVGSFVYPILGFMAFASALSGLMSEQFPREGRLRYLTWFVCLSFPSLWLTPIWSTWQDHVRQQGAWVAGEVLDEIAVANLRTEQSFELGAQTIQVSDVPATWWSLETLLSIIAICGIWFSRSFLSLAVSFKLLFFGYPLVLGYVFALHAAEVSGASGYHGLSFGVAWWVIVGVALLCTILIERFAGELGNPILFSSFDTVAPAVVESVSRIISFPNVPPNQSDDFEIEQAIETEAEEIAFSVLGEPIANKEAIQVIRLEEQERVQSRNMGLRTKDDVGS